MWGHKSKRDKCDVLFSRYIRLKSGWKCEFCHRDFSTEKQKLQNSHFYSRAKESTRYDPENCSSFCVSCHYKIGHSSESGGAYKEFMIKKLGKQNFDLLTLRAYTPKKKDRKMTFLILQEMMRELEEKTANN
jgi:hypothetical protein